MKKRRLGSASACPAAGREKKAPSASREAGTEPLEKAHGDKKRDSTGENNKGHARKGQAAIKGSGKGAPGSDKENPASLTLTAVLYEDNSHAVDYNSGTGAIEPGLERYKNIKRIGTGELSIERGGINFSIGRKLYRYDFHRVRDIKAGAKHLALFLHGTDAVKLFIFDTESEGIAAMSSAYRDYARSSEQHV